MDQSLFSPNWYRVASLKPRLRGHINIHRQVHRARVWYILEDRQNNRFHRLSDAAYFLVTQLDGNRSVGEAWRRSEERFGADLPSQDSVISLLAQLHRADLLIGDALPDIAETAIRGRKADRKALLSRYRNPIALRFPLVDPDAFLTATLPLFGWIFSRFGAALWLLLVVAGAIQVALIWPELSGGGIDQLWTMQNLLIAIGVYPVIKGIHELAHGYAVKRWGGDVPEMGVMLLIGLPVPYVDASSSLAFGSWVQRAVVSGAGIMVELGLAAAAALIWPLVEPGLMRAVLFNVMLIGGISTLLFNGNPLLRFDGYYVLCDLSGIPNLATRGNTYLGYLVQRFGFGRPDAKNPVQHTSERPWLVGYAITSFFYRTTVMLAIALLVATNLFFVGILLACMVVWTTLIWPALKGLNFVFTGAPLRKHRARSIAVTGAAVAGIAALLLALPLPFYTTTQGIVWMPQGRHVRAETSGQITEVLAIPNMRVAAGTPLIQLDDPDLRTERRVQTAWIAQLEARLRSAAPTDPAAARAINEELDRAQEERARLDDRIATLTVKAPADGIWVVAGPEDLIGEYAGQGAPLGLIHESADYTVRAVIPESTVSLVRDDLTGVEVRVDNAIDQSLKARIVREIPAGNRQLPSLALSRQGGGPFPLDSAATPENALTLTPVFQFELAFEEIPPPLYPGARAHIRFDHGAEPVARRLWRVGRQIFLARFDV
ncbi:MAG: peptidase M50 [Pseudomonadota bacterium]